MNLKHGTLKCLFYFLIPALSSSCSTPPATPAFESHDEKYFTSIAGACDQLLSKTDQAPSQQVYKGNDTSLPEPLFNLHATTITVMNHLRVRTNEIRAVDIILRGGQNIFWRPDVYLKDQPWELAINFGGEENILFSRPGHLQ